MFVFVWADLSLVNEKVFVPRSTMILIDIKEEDYEFLGVITLNVDGLDWLLGV